MDVILLYSTWPSRETAAEAGRAMVEARFAACANIFEPVTAIYPWDGAIAVETEAVMILKTTTQNAEAACAALRARHPYDTPAILAIATQREGSDADYLAWVAAHTR